MTNSKDTTAPALAWPTNVQDQQIGSRLLLSSRLQDQRRDRVGLRYEGKVTRLDADGSDLRVIGRLLIVLLRRCRSYLRGVVRFFLSSVSMTMTASSFAGAVVLALRLTRWMEPGVSYQLSPAR